MEIASLKDLKTALQNIPDDELELFGVGVDPEGSGVGLLCWDTETDPSEKWNEIEEEFPQIKDIDKWIKAINQLDRKYNNEDEEDEDFEEMVSSKDYKEVKK